MALEASCSSEKGNTIFDGAYEIISAVGRGRSSVVYEARKLHSRFHQPSDIVALKVLVGGTKDPLSNIKRMKREALAMLACRHSNIVRLLDYVAHDDICYSAMEYAAAGDLHALLEKRNSPISIDLATHFIQQVLSGLEAIHRAGIIHRDIKPENLLLTDDYVIKIGDFGVAHLPVRELSFEDGGLGIGTFDYIAPEALQEGIADFRSDTYSVAVTFYQLVTNHLPFEGQSIAQQINQKIDGNFRSLEEHLSEAPLGLDELFRVALATNPEDRFQTAREFLQAIEQFRRGEYIPKKISHRVSPSFRQLLAEPEVAKSPFQELLSDLLVHDESDGQEESSELNEVEPCDYSNPPRGRLRNWFSSKPSRFIETESEEFFEASHGLGTPRGRFKTLGLSVVALSIAAVVIQQATDFAHLENLFRGVASRLHLPAWSERSANDESQMSMASNHSDVHTTTQGAFSLFEDPTLDSAPSRTASSEKSAQGKNNEIVRLEKSGNDARAMLGSTLEVFPKSLLSAERIGVIEHLFADGSDVSLATKPVGENKFAVTLGLYGWVPVEIDAASMNSELSSGREFTVSGSGIKLVFTVESPSDTISEPEQNPKQGADRHTEGKNALHGSYREIGSGRVGTWRIW